jgi:alcohol dehydrogenase class IV
MSKSYFMPTRVIMGNNCVVENSKMFSTYGKNAMIVTGKSSAKINGAEADVVEVLKAVGINYLIYDQVMSNPTVSCVFEGADYGRDNAVDFIIAIGGGSPLDAAKAMALIIGSNLSEDNLFSGNYTEALPLIAIPTTAGTGSEVTQYSIITNDVLETKIGIKTHLIFPKVALLDAKYMMSLSVVNTVNTTIDALSHAVEGMISIKASGISDSLATRSIRMIMGCVPTMMEVLEEEDSTLFTLEMREKFLYASTLAGMVIAQTGTTAVHAMGYALTYNKQIDHGRANGLLIGEFLRFTEKGEPKLVARVLEAMDIRREDVYIDMMRKLFGELEPISNEEIRTFSAKAILAGNISNCPVIPTVADLEAIFMASFGVK